MKQKILQMMFAAFVCAGAHAQVNTGSNGGDGALDFSAYANLNTNIVINMADHPNGIYQYTYVNIPSGVTVTFIPNANNTPVYWLVQSNVVISGTVDVSGQNANGQTGGIGGPGGWNGGLGGTQGTSGQGPGGGLVSTNGNGGGGQYNYGNVFLIPLLGGSGGGAGDYGWPEGGGGGGGAILIASSATITLNGSVNANGGTGGGSPYGYGSIGGGGGSGGAVRFVASRIVGTGWVNPVGQQSNGGNGQVRFDTYENDYSGGTHGSFSVGSQFVIIPTSGQLPQLTVTSVGGVVVSASPKGVLFAPDAVLSAQQNNPIPVVVSCANLPLNTLITVSVTPANGSPVSATGYNTTGTQTSSTATISIVIPRGGGLIYATAATSN
jgi:hypothetical protein